MNIFVMMECKKIAILGHFAECCTRQRTPLPSAMVTTLGKAGKMGDQKTDFPTLPSAVTITLGKEIKKQIKLCRVPGVLALGKENFQKKIKALCRVPSGLALGKEFFLKK